jgi:replicative DNA helicase
MTASPIRSDSRGIPVRSLARITGFSSQASISLADIAEEKAALGACFLGQARDAVRLLASDDFSLSSHREVFAVISDLVSRGEVALEISLVAAELRKRGGLEAIGGVAYLADLDHGVVPEREMNSRVKILRDFANRRRVIRAAEVALTSAQDLTQPLAFTIESLREAIG